MKSHHRALQHTKTDREIVQLKSVVEPDGVADDFRWKSIAVVAWRIGLHWTILSVTSSI